MNNNHHHQPPLSPSPPSPSLECHTVAQIFKHTTSIFFSHPITFLFLSSLLLTFRFNVENGTHLLTDFIDNDPSLRPLLSRIDVSAPNPHSSSSSFAHPRRRGPFLHLTRVGTLDDDFFSGDEDTDRRSLFGSHTKYPPNGTFVIFDNFEFRSGFSNYVYDNGSRISDDGISVSEDGIRVSDNGIRVPEIVRSGFSLKLVNRSLQSIADQNSKNDELNTVKNSRVLDFQFFTKGLELRPLVFLICLLSTAYGYVLLGFLVTYSWVLGIVFVVVVNHFLGKRRWWMGTVWDGSILGIKRASGFVLMRWAVRDAMSQLLGLWYFGEVDDQYSFFKIFLRLKLMPFSLTNQWVRGFEKETGAFLFAWIMTDVFLEFVFAVDSWVAIVDSRMSGREIVMEGCHLLTIMFNQAAVTKGVEFMLCGSFTRWVLARYFGKLFATAFQSVIEVYFLVAWLIFYFALRIKDATSLGRTFGQRDLEGFIQGNR